MRYDPHIDYRRSIRLPTWDYGDDGAYFVTICTHNRTPLFGSVVADQMVLNPLGRTVEDIWCRVVGAPRSVGEFVVMPNHIHGIVWIERVPIVVSRPPVPPVTPVGVEQPRRLKPGQRSGLIRRPSAHPAVAQPLRSDVAPIRRGLRDGLEPGSLFVIVRTFKSAAAKRINTLCGTRGARVWQRDYYDRIIRDDRELDRIRQYILDNPRKWAEDKHNPAVFQKRLSRPEPTVGVEHPRSRRQRP